MKNLSPLKSILLLLTLILGVDSSASPLRRQSLTSFSAIVNRYVKYEIPFPGYQENFDQYAVNFLKPSSWSSHLRFGDEAANFAFANKKEDFLDFIDVDLGLCRGFASLRRKFRVLALFDVDNVYNQVIPDRELDPKGFVKFYRDLVQDVRRYTPTIIPGFENLRELSSDSLLGPMIKKEILEEWKVKNFSRGSGTNQLLKGVLRASTYDELKEMKHKIDAYSALGLNTMIWLSVKFSTWIHVLEAIETSPVQSDGSFRIRFWNDKFITGENVFSYLTVSGDGEIFYDDGIERRKINAAGVTKDNDGELLMMAQSLQDLNLVLIPQE